MRPSLQIQSPRPPTYMDKMVSYRLRQGKDSIAQQCRRAANFPARVRIQHYSEFSPLAFRLYHFPNPRWGFGVIFFIDPAPQSLESDAVFSDERRAKSAQRRAAIGQLREKSISFLLNPPAIAVLLNTRARNRAIIELEFPYQRRKATAEKYHIGVNRNEIRSPYPWNTLVQRFAVSKIPVAFD